MKGSNEEKFKILAEKHASNAKCMLVQFAVQTEVSVAVYFDWQSQVRAKEGGQLPLKNTEEGDGGTRWGH